MTPQSFFVFFLFFQPLSFWLCSVFFSVALQDARSSLCPQQTCVWLKEPLQFLNATPPMTPESILGTCPPVCPLKNCPLSALKHVFSEILQLQVGSWWCASSSKRRWACLCAPGLTLYWADLVRWHWGLHLHCDITGWQWLPHCTPWSHVSSYSSLLLVQKWDFVHFLN